MPTSPHAVGHDRDPYVAFSRNEAAIEVVKLPLGDIDALRGKGRGPGRK